MFSQTLKKMVLHWPVTAFGPVLRPALHARNMPAHWRLRFGQQEPDKNELSIASVNRPQSHRQVRCADASMRVWGWLCVYVCYETLTSVC